MHPPDRGRRRFLQALPALAAFTGAAPRRAAALDHDQIDALLQDRLVDQGIGLAALQLDGARLDIVARGQASEGVALREDALFEIGSITKTFTALLLADAVLRKRLALDDPIEAALPGVTLRDSTRAPIRWVDVATHRSGLPRLPTNMAPRTAGNPYEDYDEAHLLAFLRDYKASVPRDTRWEYSNLGFGLLGYALARVESTTYARLLSERVLGPLGMTRSGLALRGQPIKGRIEGHDRNRQPVPAWDFDVMASAGGLVMPAADLARYARAATFPDSSPLGPAFVLAQREHAAGRVPMNPMGLAWIRAPLNGRIVLNHDGATGGFSSSLWLDPTRGRAAAVLANAAVETNDLALHLLDESIPANDYSATRQAEVPLGANEVAPLAGLYGLDARFKLAITISNGELWAQATGQSASRLYANASRRFFARVTPLEIEFDTGSPPAGLTLRQGGRVLRFVRE